MQLGGLNNELQELLQTKQRLLEFLFIWLKRLINFFIYIRNYHKD
jgi:hypothetical protein